MIRQSSGAVLQGNGMRGAVRGAAQGLTSYRGDNAARVNGKLALVQFHAVNRNPVDKFGKFGSGMDGQSALRVHIVFGGRRAADRSFVYGQVLLIVVDLPNVRRGIVRHAQRIRLFAVYALIAVERGANRERKLSGFLRHAV